MIYGRGNKPIPIPITFQIDIDHVHSVMRLTVKVEIVTLEVAEDIYSELTLLSRKGSPWAAIFDLSAVKHTTISTGSVRSFGRHRRPAVAMGDCPFCGHPRKQVVVGEAPHIYSLGRMFEMCADATGKDFQVVHTLEEAYEIVEDRPENFNECMLIEELA